MNVTLRIVLASWLACGLPWHAARADRQMDPALRGVVFGRNAYATAGVGSILRRGDSVQLLPQPL